MMIRKYWWKILLSSLATLLPASAAPFFRNSVRMGMVGMWYFTWLMPVILVTLNLTAILISLRDNSHNGQNKKILNMIFWIMPVISIYTCGVFMMLALGVDFNVTLFVFAILGVSFIVMGNYTPKAVRNRTFGIKIKWTLANDDNWAATHRFTGKLWVVCGFATLLASFLPMQLGIIVVTVILLVAVIPPVVYSYLFYRKQLAEGTASKDDFKSYPMGAKDKKTLIITLVLVGVLLVAITVMMFVGNICFELGEDSLEITTSYGGAMTLDYDDIDSIEYRDCAVEGYRLSGYGSARLLFGLFRNDELGDYVRYTYTGSDSAIIIKVDTEILVIAAEDADTTRAIYDELLIKTNKGE